MTETSPVTPDALRTKAAEWETKARDPETDDAMARRLLTGAANLRVRADREAALLRTSPAGSPEQPLTAEALVDAEFYDEALAHDALAYWQARADDLAAAAEKRQRQGKAALASEARALAKAREQAYAISTFIDSRQPVHLLETHERFPQ